MSSFSPIRGTRAQIAATPIVDGQFLVETDSSGNNKIYADIDNSNRRVVGGGSGLLPHITIIAPSGTTLSDVIITGTGGSTIPVTVVSGTTFECIVDNFGVYNIAIGSYNRDLNIQCANEYTVELEIISSSPVWKVSGDIFHWHDEILVPATGQTVYNIVDSMFKTTSRIFPMAETDADGNPAKYKSIKCIVDGTIVLEFSSELTNTLPISIGVC